MNLKNIRRGFSRASLSVAGLGVLLGLLLIIIDVGFLIDLVFFMMGIVTIAISLPTLISLLPFRGTKAGRVSFIVTAVAVAAGFLMFLLKNKLAKRIVFYASVALGVVLSAAGLYVAAVSALPFFVGVSVAGLILSIGALLLERFGKDKAKGFVLARVGSVAALALGLYSLYLW